MLDRSKERTPITQASGTAPDAHGAIPDQSVPLERELVVPFDRTRLVVVLLLAVLLLSPLLVFWLASGPDLKMRLAKVSLGMDRKEVEGQLGPAVIVLQNGQGRPGCTLYWVDQLWQVDVVLDGEGKAVRFGCVPSNSPFRQTVGRIITLPK